MYSKHSKYHWFYQQWHNAFPGKCATKKTCKMPKLPSGSYTQAYIKKALDNGSELSFGTACLQNSNLDLLFAMLPSLAGFPFKRNLFICFSHPLTTGPAWITVWFFIKDTCNPHVLFHLNCSQGIGKQHSEEIFKDVSIDSKLVTHIGTQSCSTSDEAEQDGPAHVRQATIEYLQDFQGHPAIEWHSEDEHLGQLASFVEFASSNTHGPPRRNYGHNQLLHLGRAETENRLEHVSSKTGAIWIQVTWFHLEGSPKGNTHHIQYHGV